MEHGNKIEKGISGKEFFLQNSTIEYEKPNIYSLETEFAKTKKNQDLKPYLIFFGFIFLLILSTLLTTNYLEVKSKQINIDISDFEDLRLKETLTAAKEKEQELNRKTEELNNKTKQLNSKAGELKNLQSTFNSKVQFITEQIQQESDLKHADKKALQRLETKSKKQIDDLKKQYETQAAQKQAENDQLKQDQKELTLQLHQSTQLFEAYQFGLGSFLKSKKAIGCVIDPRQRGNIIVFLIKGQKVTTETLVEVYRGDGEYIGKLKLTPDKTGLLASMVEVIKHQSIMPLDWFKLP